MMSGSFLLLALCASLLQLPSVASHLISQKWTRDPLYDPGEGPEGVNTVVDCDPTDHPAINQAVSDAIWLAQGARDALASGLQPHQLSFFDKVFSDSNGPFSRSKIART
jgi:hypothetical protein